ncbi:MAG: hypothetical protein WC679_01330 [Bacteroidales bacterium]|jgi:hypothetical protein
MAIEKIGLQQILEGIRYDGTNLQEIKEFVRTGKNIDEWVFEEDGDNYRSNFHVGHWAIKLITGKIYNITPEYFDENYHVIKEQ